MTASRFELRSERHKVSRLPTEPPGRPAPRDTMIYGGNPNGYIGAHW